MVDENLAREVNPLPVGYLSDGVRALICDPETGEELLCGEVEMCIRDRYNSEEYLGETLESVAAQTVGMDAVQVVIVDDGSTDGSAAICRSFQDRYPANVVFHQQPNGGVSSARNAGLDRASGRIVTCLDSDDQWTPESFAYAVDFFEMCIRDRARGRWTGTPA